MRKLSVAMVAGGAAAIVLCALLWIRDDSRELASKKIPETSPQEDLSIKGLDYVQTKDGIREWRLTAGSAHFSKEHNQTRLENVRFTYFTKDQKQVVVTGKEGFFNTKSLDVNLCGNVNIKSDEGYEFEAPSVKYVAKAKEIQSADQVMFRGNQIQITGKGMRVFINQGKVVIMKNVQATISKVAAKRDQSS